MMPYKTYPRIIRILVATIKMHLHLLRNEKEREFLRFSDKTGKLIFIGTCSGQEGSLQIHRQFFGSFPSFTE